MKIANLPSRKITVVLVGPQNSDAEIYLFDASDASNLKQLHHIPLQHPIGFDVPSNGESLLVYEWPTTSPKRDPGGIRNYSLADPTAPQLKQSLPLRIAAARLSRNDTLIAFTHTSETPFIETRLYTLQNQELPQIAATSGGADNIPTNFVGDQYVIGNDYDVSVAAFELVSGAGRGCSQTFFDVLDNDGSTFNSGNAHKLLMTIQKADPNSRRPLEACGNKARFFRYNDKIYYENKPAAWPPTTNLSQYHRVVRADGASVKEVCEFTYQTTARALFPAASHP